MPDQFERIAEYARRTSVLDDATGIRAKGTRRIRRRRVGQATLGTGALAVVTGIGATLAMGSPGHASVSAGASSSFTPTRGGASASTTASASVGASANTTAVPNKTSATSGYASASPATGAAAPGPGSTVNLPSNAVLTIGHDGTVSDYYLNVQEPGAAKVVYGLSAQMDGVIQFLQRFGFSHVMLKADSSAKTVAQYPVDYVTDIRNSSGQSVLDKTISTGTTLVIVYCANPNG